MKKKKSQIIEEIKPQEKIKKEQLISNFKIKFKKTRKSSISETINLNQNNSNIPNNVNKDMEINADTSIKKEDIKMDVLN